MFHELFKVLVNMTHHLECPIENVSNQIEFEKFTSCPFHKTTHKTVPGKQEVKSFPSKSLPHENLQNSKFTADLLKDVGGGDKIRQMTTRFYAHAFEDETLSKFMFDTDGAAAHGQRLGDWIIEKMGGEGDVWTNSGREGMRRVSHSRAWNCDKRKDEKRGQRFKLDDSRIWMRLMFWSGREVGLSQHEAFWKWYNTFLKTYIGIYTRTAPPYTKYDAEWSKNKNNIQKYIESGKAMTDVIGLGR